ncbi:hypothetical protein CKAH01_03771 [Colletotrichum kahawae]|uniref:Uncharacterized protein n=1 Tax=Colletotrichum kahawae TaxID=34407 RepID=A0AAE0D9P4_COLKA|nr:hypothetical protein CKAH01_03771 [Colletotrichum kahawae]
MEFHLDQSILGGDPGRVSTGRLTLQYCTTVHTMHPFDVPIRTRYLDWGLGHLPSASSAFRTPLLRCPGFQNTQRRASHCTRLAQPPRSPLLVSSSKQDQDKTCVRPSTTQGGPSGSPPIGNGANASLRLGELSLGLENFGILPLGKRPRGGESRPRYPLLLGDRHARARLSLLNECSRLISTTRTGAHTDLRRAVKQLQKAHHQYVPQTRSSPFEARSTQLISANPKFRTDSYHLPAYLPTSITRHHTHTQGAEHRPRHSKTRDEKLHPGDATPPPTQQIHPHIETPYARFLNSAGLPYQQQIAQLSSPNQARQRISRRRARQPDRHGGPLHRPHLSSVEFRRPSPTPESTGARQRNVWIEGRLEMLPDLVWLVMASRMLDDGGAWRRWRGGGSEAVHDGLRSSAASASSSAAAITNKSQTNKPCRTMHFISGRPKKSALSYESIPIYLRRS